MELINGRTAEEIKRGLKCCHHVCTEECPYYREGVKASECTTPMSRDALALIERLEAAQPRWISVEDKLPELDQDVLVYATGKEAEFLDSTHIVVSQRYIFHIFPWDQGVEEWQAPWHYFNRNYKVTHWMPLPEPPKEGAE